MTESHTCGKCGKVYTRDDDRNAMIDHARSVAAKAREEGDVDRADLFVQVAAILAEWRPPTDDYSRSDALEQLGGMADLVEGMSARGFGMCVPCFLADTDRPGR